MGVGPYASCGVPGNRRKKIDNMHKFSNPMLPEIIREPVEFSKGNGVFSDIQPL